MKIAYLAENSDYYKNLKSESAVDRRRLAVFETVWRSCGVELVPWKPNIVCDVVYIVNIQRNIKISNFIINNRKNEAIVSGIVEDVFTGIFANSSISNINNIESIIKDYYYNHKKNKFRILRNYLSNIGIYKTQQQKVLEIISKSDAVICTSGVQASSLLHINPFCTGIADCIPDSDYAIIDEKYGDEIKKLKEKNGTVCLVWEGTAWGLQLLETIRNSIEELQRRVSNPILLVVVMPKKRPDFIFGTNDNDSILKNKYKINTRHYEWDINTVGSILRACDIALAPMPENNPFYRAKAFSKPLVYMSLGIPVVASPIPSYCELINNKENGFIAYTQDEWVEIMLDLVVNNEKRKHIGRLAIDRVVKYHSIDNVSKEYLSIFKKSILIKQQKFD